jgi:hypothetical protein
MLPRTSPLSSRTSLSSHALFVISNEGERSGQTDKKSMDLDANGAGVKKACFTRTIYNKNQIKQQRNQYA